MSDYNLFLIRPRYNVLDKIKFYFTLDFDVLNPDFQIYVPSKFVMGPFKRQSENDLFDLDFDRIYFKDSKDVLNEYKENFNNSRFEVLNVISIGEGELEKFLRVGTHYNSIKDDLSKLADSYVLK